MKAMKSRGTRRLPCDRVPDNPPLRGAVSAPGIFFFFTILPPPPPLIKQPGQFWFPCCGTFVI